MEASFLNIHDEDFSMQFDPYDSSEESPPSLMTMIDNDYDYSEYIEAHEYHESQTEDLWDSEQMHNGDLVILPNAGVATKLPEFENHQAVDVPKLFPDWHDPVFNADMGVDMYLPNLSMNSLVNINTNLPAETLPDDILHFPQIKNEVPSFIEKNEDHLPVTDYLVNSDSKNLDLLSINDNEYSLINELPKLSNSPGKLFASTSPVSKDKNINKINIDSKTKIFKNVSVKAEPESCVDSDTVSDHEPILEATSITSLFEKFEASAAELVDKTEKKTLNKPQVSMKKYPSIDKSKKKLLKKSVNSQESKLHKNIRDSLPKEIVDRIKSSGRKTSMQIIPALPEKKTESLKVQKTTSTLSKNLKTTSVTKTNETDKSIKLDHDYCSNNATKNSQVIKKIQSCQEKKRNTAKQLNMNKLGRIAVCKDIDKRGEKWTDNNSKKDSGLESGDVSDAGEEHTITNNTETLNKKSMTKINSKKIENLTSVGIKNNKHINDIKKNITDIKNKKNIKEIQTNSILTTKILQLPNGVLTKTKNIDAGHKNKPMVSVLKKPPVLSTSIMKNNPNESIVTTKNSLNNEVKNIIVRDVSQTSVAPVGAVASTSISSTVATTTTITTTSIQNEDDKKQFKKTKINLTEYRNRRGQTLSDNSGTCSPVQPLTLLYTNNANTSTEPTIDETGIPQWCVREILSVLKPKAEFEDIKLRAKPEVRSISIQTNETVFRSTFEVIDNNLVEKNTDVNIPVSQSNGNDNDNSVVEIIQLNHDNDAGKISQSNDNNDVKIIESNDNNDDVKIIQLNDNAKTIVDESIAKSSQQSEKYKPRSYRQRRSSSSLSSSSTSRSRSRSPSYSRKYSSKPRRRLRGSSRSRSRSRSRLRRRNTRRRTLSHRHSSVSSESSYSSRSRSRSPYRSRSHSRSKSRSRSRSTSRSTRSRSSSRSSRSRSRSRSSSRSSSGYSNYSRRPVVNPRFEGEKKREVEERRVIYVGRLADGITKADLRRRFESFGPVLDISLHFREHRDNYGFVTFAYKNDAYQAVEHGNDDPSLPRYDLSFGGRRAFCKVKYADLDGMGNDSFGGDRGDGGNGEYSSGRSLINTEEENSFDLLLKEAQEKLRKRKP